MATVSAGALNLTANITGDFGHHVITSDQTRQHTTEYRTPCAVKRSSTAGQHTQTHDWEKVLDWNQYPQATVLYIQEDYIPDDYIREFKPQQQAVQYEAETLDSDQKVTVRFDFADYYPTQVKTNLEINFDVTFISGVAEYLTVTSGTASQAISVGTDQNYSATLNDFAFDSGIIDVELQSDNANIAVSNIQARISVTGSTRAFSDWIDSNISGVINNTASTDTGIIKDTRLQFSDLEITLPSNLLVAGSTTAIGIIDSTNAQNTENPTTANVSGYDIDNGSAVFATDSRWRKINAGYTDDTTPYHNDSDGSETLLSNLTEYSAGFFDGVTGSVWFHWDGTTASGKQTLFEIADLSATTDTARGMYLTIGGSQTTIQLDPSINLSFNTSELSTGWNNITFSSYGPDDKADTLAYYPVKYNGSTPSFSFDPGNTGPKYYRGHLYVNGRDITSTHDFIVYQELTVPTYISNASLLVGCTYNHNTQTITNSDTTNAPIYSVYFRDRYIDLDDADNLKAFYHYGLIPTTEPFAPNFPSKTYIESKTTISAETGPDLYISRSGGTIQVETQGYYRRQSIASEWPSGTDFSGSIYPGSGYPYVWDDNATTVTPSATSNVSIVSLTGPSADLETDLQILAANGSVLAENTNVSTIIGGAPVTLINTDHDRYTADDDTPVINYFVNSINGLQNADVANTTVRLANIHPAISSFENTFVRHRYIMVLPQTGTPESFDVTTDVTTLATVIIEAEIDTQPVESSMSVSGGVIIENTVDTMAVSFTEQFQGGILRISDTAFDIEFTQTAESNPLRSLLSIDLDVSATYASADAGTGVTIDAEIDNINGAFTKGLLTVGVIIRGEVDTIGNSFSMSTTGGLFINADIDSIDTAFSVTADPTRFTMFVDQRLIFKFFPRGAQTIDPNTGKIHHNFHDDIRDLSGNPIAPGVTVRRIAEYDDQNIAFATEADPQLLLSQNQFDLDWAFAKVSIATVFSAPLAYHTIIFEPVTRRVTAHSDRTATVDDQTRTATAHSDRTVQAETETRTMGVRLKYD